MLWTYTCICIICARPLFKKAMPFILLTYKRRENVWLAPVLYIRKKLHIQLLTKGNLWSQLTSFEFSFNKQKLCLVLDFSDLYRTLISTKVHLHQMCFIYSFFSFILILLSSFSLTWVVFLFFINSNQS